MGDMADVFSEMKKSRKDARSRRLEKANSEGWEKHSAYHWFRVVDGKKINYWPSSGLCMIGKRKHSINSKLIKNLIGEG